LGYSFCELSWISFEPFLAGYAAEMIGFAIVGDLELGRIFVENCAANRISGHMLVLWRVCVLLIIISVRGEKCASRVKTLRASLVSS